MSKIYKQLYALVDKMVEHFRADLKIDEKTIGDYPVGTPFLHSARKTGTQMLMLSTEGYPPKGDKIKYLFGYATREKILKSEVDAWIHHYKVMSVKTTHYYNGVKLKKVSPEESIKIAQRWREEILSKWENETIEQSIYES